MCSSRRTSSTSGELGRAGKLGRAEEMGRARELKRAEERRELRSGGAEGEGAAEGGGLRKWKLGDFEGALEDFGFPYMLLPDGSPLRYKDEKVEPGQ
jgi:hypothetical protein